MWAQLRIKFSKRRYAAWICPALGNPMPIHIAITRRVRPGREAEFKEALREFFQTSFAHTGVLGANMLVPPPGSDSREFGILRTFRTEKERDEFYNSPLFKAWDERARALTEGEPEYRELHGLEAWFRSPTNPPPRWKMALVTLCGVLPASLLLNLTVAGWLHEAPLVLRALVISALMVMMLTWILMPLLTKLFKPWLHANRTPREQEQTGKTIQPK